MTTHKGSTQFRRSWPWWRCIITGLSILALSLSCYMSWYYLVEGTVIGCGDGSSCDEVLSSRWSSIAGVLPVSGLAVGVYLAMLISVFLIGPSTEESVRRMAWGAMLILVSAAAGSAVWFTVLQKWFIGAFCLYCMAAHVTGLILAILIVSRATRPFKDVTSKRIVGRLPAIGLVIVGLAMAGIMAVLQVIIPPPAKYIKGLSQGNLPVIDQNTVPMVGSPDAEYIVTLLFDYKCPHCQKMHFMLNEVIRRYEGKLAFMLCPSPLDKKCNPYILREADQYKDSCEQVKIGLAVWLANREVFSDFENWMFSFESGDRWRPRSLEATKAKAIELIGQEKFDTALVDSWIDRYLKTSIQIYSQTIRNGKGGVPRLVFGSRWVIPEPYSADDLIIILQDSLEVPMP